uniref:DNA replication licensing factor MCM5 n=1 Tax=Arcella intermedia TaxID=1963864 RepID=A0A6B2L1Q7_9EUKA
MRDNYRNGRFWIQIEFEDISFFDSTIADELTANPHKMLRVFETAIKFAVLELHIIDDQTRDIEDLPSIQVLVSSNSQPIPIRRLEKAHLNHLIRVPGIVVSAFRPQAKATELVVMCTNCGLKKIVPVRGGFGGAEIPTYCDNPNPPKKCPNNSYKVVPELSKFIDIQLLKLQESPETVPTGEMPRPILLVVERNLVERIVPGSRITATGTYTIYKSAASRQIGATAVRHPYLQAYGITMDTEGNGRARNDFTAIEIEEFRKLAHSQDIYQKIVQSIAPAIYGHTDIKRVVATQLFGGCAKHLSDGINLRGDINILLLGDPGTAKSQILKFVEKVSPIGVYTSGKGSSAAGLTASVSKDPSTKEFYLEGGAMVLADRGIVCIDEFDKMRIQDRVAIHEAMEQQTISIAKAGITTILNSRTAVLAAANPNFGSYDDTRTTQENLNEFRSSILSRFDCIFLIKDTRNEQRDLTIARHVMDVHMKASTGDEPTPISLNTLKRYISYCKA